MRAQPTTKQLIAMLYERLPELFERPKRTWVGLTDEDCKEIERQYIYVEGAIRLTEAKLKEKNTP